MSRLRRSLVVVAMLPVLSMLLAWGGDTERKLANRFVLEKLSQQRGAYWERVGSLFIWEFEFERGGCVLNMVREDREGGHRLRQWIPMADTSPHWDGGPEILLACAGGSDCIRYRQIQGGELIEGQLGQSRLPIMHGPDAPKLLDALLELERLCDDRY